MRVHSIEFVEACEAVAMAGGETVRSRDAVLPWLTNGWNAGARLAGPMRKCWSLVTYSPRVTNGWCIAPKIRAQHHFESTFARGRLAWRVSSGPLIQAARVHLRAPVPGEQNPLRKLREPLAAPKMRGRTSHVIALGLRYRFVHEKPCELHGMVNA